jgi:hypothetical protein
MTECVKCHEEIDHSERFFNFPGAPMHIECGMEISDKAEKERNLAMKFAKTVQLTKKYR